MATLISYAIMAGMLFVESQRLIRVDINLKALLLTGMITVASWFLLSRITLENPWGSLSLKMVILIPLLVTPTLWFYKRRRSAALGKGTFEGISQL